jgi:hypothetical protein
MYIQDKGPSCPSQKSSRINGEPGSRIKCETCKPNKPALIIPAKQLMEEIACRLAAKMPTRSMVLLYY